jgi:hypothetical protein
MRDAEIKDLAGSEVMTWDINRIPMAVSEAMGPLVVRLKGDVVRMYHWWCFPTVDRGTFNTADSGKLWIRDPSKYNMVVGEHERGTWDECTYDHHLAGLF